MTSQPTTRQANAPLPRHLLITAIVAVAVTAVSCVFYAARGLILMPMWPPIAYPAAAIVHLMSLAFLLSAAAGDKVRMRHARPILLFYSAVMATVVAKGFTDLHPDSPTPGVILICVIAVGGPLFAAMVIPRVPASAPATDRVTEESS
ncbi:hypothetical protein [Amycolatopsis sp. TNS106]|uniref:hypothetical protein n=1 Tax=Amycolatopsis sp. TNS106 TaxID=2861750 RepID=UPI001C56DA7B|nr:hypothetical protein [Amycolatopsis sp. TNS106]QXV63579.1 hypothetical protein CVV72_41200 [Amycolatopsis sp. TNS106]